jgi:hypothetical protein
MEIHKAKPWRGWREFLREYVIVVVGVLTALGAEELAQAWRWRQEVVEARHEFRFEIGTDLSLISRRADLADCVDRRLDELALVLAHASQTGHLPPLGFVGQPPRWILLEDAWSAQKSSQAAAHFSADELQSIGRVYRFMEGAALTRDGEIAAWNRLESLAGPGRRLDPVTEGQAYEALTRARDANQTTRRLRIAIKSILRQTGLGEDFPQINTRNAPLGVLQTGELCRPIMGAPPPIYGRLPVSAERPPR